MKYGNPYSRGARLASMMPLLIASALMPERENNRGLLRWPEPYDAEKDKRLNEEKMEAARLKRERRAAKRAKLLSK